MKTGISVEWGYLSRGVNIIVIRKLRKVENVGPIVLLITQKASKLFQCLVCSFRLPVGLRMVAGGEVTRDLENLKEVLPKFGDKLRSSVTDDIVWEAMMPKYLTHDKGHRRSDTSLRGGAQEEHVVLPEGEWASGVHQQNPPEYIAEDSERKPDGLGHKTKQCAMGLQDKL